MGLKVIPKPKKAQPKMPPKASPPGKNSPAKPKAKGKKKGDAKASVRGPGPMVSAEELEYMAEDDARTLMRAEEIKRDAARLRKAKAVAQKKADEAMQVAKL